MESEIKKCREVKFRGSSQSDANHRPVAKVRHQPSRKSKLII